MKKLLIAALPALALALLPLVAVADGYKLTTHKFPDEFTTLTAASVASGDYIPVWDASANDWKRVDATTTNGANWTGATIVASGAITGLNFVPTGATLPANGVYLPAANTVGIATRSLGVAQFTNAASNVNQFIFTGTATAGLNTIATGGSGADATAPILLGGNSTGIVYLGGTTAANSGFEADAVASGVNHIIATSTATAGLTKVSVGGTGADATAPALFGGNTTGIVYIGNTTTANSPVKVVSGSSNVNQIVITGTNTGTAPSIAVGGSGGDANRSLTILPIGSGSTVFGAAGTANGTITLSGSTSGTTIITPAATASGTLTLPAITGSVVAKGTPVACGSTCTLGAANKNTYTRLDTAGGSAATLPTATGTGDTYAMYISVANSSNQDKVLLATVTDTIIGTAQGENAGTAKVFVGNAGTYHSIQMPFAGTQPSGGFVGDTIVCTDVASTIWKCDIMYQAGTTPTTPYNTGTT